MPLPKGNEEFDYEVSIKIKFGNRPKMTEEEVKKLFILTFLPDDADCVRDITLDCSIEEKII